jgi:Domain of unknown function (DUF932)
MMKPVMGDGGTETVRLTGLNAENLGLNRVAHAQVAEDLGIPKPYYDRMLREAPRLLSLNVNQWLLANPQKRMVRTLDGAVRGWLSPSYRPIDNAEMAEAVLPALQTAGAKVDSCELTDTRLYIKASFPSTQYDIALAKREAMLKAGIGLHTEYPEPDTLQAAVTIRNSEVGYGAIAVEESILRMVCYNLATVAVRTRRTHVGKRQSESDEIQVVLSSEARQAEDRALFLRMRDTVNQIASPERFGQVALRMAATAGDRMVAPVDEVVQAVAERWNLGETVRKGVLQHLAEGGDLTRYGLINAVTRASVDVEDYDDATDLERLGGTLIELPRSEWRTLAEAV